MRIGRKKNQERNTEALRAQRRWDKNEEGVELRAKAVRARVADQKIETRRATENHGVRDIDSEAV